MKHNLQLRILSYLVIAYMLLAFGWWTILLFQKNQDAYHAKIEYLQLIAAAQGESKSIAEFRQTPIYQQLTNDYQKQEWMIMGEALVFVISIVIGVWLINRGYNRAIDVAQQGRNFLLSITHELKSPIASIRLTLDTFLKRDLTKAQSDILSQNALQETERLHHLVNNLLLAAKIEERYQPVFENQNLTKIVRETIFKLEQKYPLAKIDFQTFNNIVMLYADSLGMQSVVINLIENAIKYSFENPYLEVHLYEKGNEVVFKVADNGVGIQDKEKKRVFDRFYRIGNEDTRKTKGTGLGLYIVKEIIESHKGNIKILDNQPTGSIFVVRMNRQNTNL